MGVGMNERRPFEIFFDTDSATGETSMAYYMFLPNGSVMLDCVNCTCDDRVSDLYVKLDIASEDGFPEKIYGHIDKEEYKVFFDGDEEPEQEEGEEKDYINFVVASFGAEENDGLRYDVCTGAVNFSTGGMNLIAGKDTHIVFTKVTEEMVEEQGYSKDDIGKYAVNVYYL